MYVLGDVRVILKFKFASSSCHLYTSLPARSWRCVAIIWYHGKGATTSTKSGATLCLVSFIVIICSSILTSCFSPSVNTFLFCTGDVRIWFVCNYSMTNHALWVGWMESPRVPLFILLETCRVWTVSTADVDALASLCFIAVGNCLETLFKNTFPARVMVWMSLSIYRRTCAFALLPSW